MTQMQADQPLNKLGRQQQEKHANEDSESWRLHLQRADEMKDGTELWDGEYDDAPQSRGYADVYANDAAGDDMHLPQQQHKHHLRRLNQDVDVAIDADAASDINNGNAPELQQHHHHHERYEWETTSVEKPKKHKKHKAIPKPEAATMHALMIDCGSGGTRIHLYEFERRTLSKESDLLGVLGGKKLSIPTTNSRWTKRIKPGIQTLVDDSMDDAAVAEAVREHLGSHLDFAKSVLATKEDEWDKYPIFLKATGGARTLVPEERTRLMRTVREVFHEDDFNPFQFNDERARVISGEEEAIYGWAAVNYLMGTLVEDTESFGITPNPKKTYGMLALGGASAQIGFFQNNGDVMANLFKFQLGGSRHWNVYSHSFLYFGVNGAWERLNAELYNNGRGTNVNPCLPASSTVDFSSWVHLDETGTRNLPRSDPQSSPYTVSMINDVPNVEGCGQLARHLLRKETNAEWVNFSHDGESSFAGVYQPPLPTNSSEVDRFIAVSNFPKVWAFLKLEPTSTVRSIGVAAKTVCSMPANELIAYNEGLEDPVHDDVLFQYCFRSMFVYEMLHTGYGFPLDYELLAASVMNNQKLGWALGSILYEINIMPWELEDNLMVSSGKSSHHARSSFIDTDDLEAGLKGGVIMLALVFIMMMWKSATCKSKTERHGYEAVPSVTEKLNA